MLPHWGKRYYGLIPEEPIGFIWSSRPAMHDAGAFLARQGSIDSLDGSVSALMLCGKYNNTIHSMTDVTFFGQATTTAQLNRANLALAQCIIQPEFQGLRVYVSSGKPLPFEM